METELEKMHDCLDRMKHVSSTRDFIKQRQGYGNVHSKLEEVYDKLGEEFIQLIEDYLISLAQPVEPYTLPKSVVMDMGPLGVELDGEPARCNIPPFKELGPREKMRILEAMYRNQLEVFDHSRSMWVRVEGHIALKDDACYRSPYKLVVKQDELQDAVPPAHYLSQHDRDKLLNAIHVKGAVQVYDKKERKWVDTFGPIHFIDSNHYRLTPNFSLREHMLRN